MSDAIRMSWRAGLGLMAALLLFPSGARAAEIDLSTYVLQPNLANQVISIYVYGGDMVNGVNLNVETGDGVNGPPFDAPVITAVNLVATDSLSNYGNNGGTGASAFANNNNGPNAFNVYTNDQTPGQFWEATTQTQAGTVTLGSANVPVLLATITVDTTGLTSGTFALLLDDPRDPTTFAYGMGSTMYPTIVDGFIMIGSGVAPEPASIGLLGLGLGGLLLRRRRMPVS